MIGTEIGPVGSIRESMIKEVYVESIANLPGGWLVGSDGVTLVPDGYGRYHVTITGSSNKY